MAMMAHECNACGMMFVNKSDLIIHMHIHRGTTPHTCEVCSKPFSSRHNRDRHMLSHSGVKDYPCDMCDKAFSTKGNLVTHHRIHTGEKPWRCPECDRDFGNKIDLTYHTRTHTGEMPHNCSVCGKLFRVKSNLTRHMRVHTGERPHRCEVCDMSFSEKGNLARHTRVHFMFTKTRPCKTEAETPYKCEICLTSFSKRGNLQRHSLTHSVNKPHTCEICDRGFVEKKGLERHIRTHIGESQHSGDGDGKSLDVSSENIMQNVLGVSFNGKCNFAMANVNSILSDTINNKSDFPMKNEIAECDDSLNSERDTLPLDYLTTVYDKSNLAMLATMGSLASGHGSTNDKNNLHVCVICGETYADERILDMHMQLHTDGNAFPESFSNYTNPKHANISIEDSQHTCNICEISFSDETLLAIHMKVHTEGEEEYTSRIFQRSSTKSASPGQVTIKSEENEYSCNACYVSFTDETDLAMHMRIHTERTKYFSKPTPAEFVTTNSTDKKYKCSFCDKTFSNQIVLDMHINKHVERCKTNVLSGPSTGNSISGYVSVKSDDPQYKSNLYEETFSEGGLQLNVNKDNKGPADSSEIFPQTSSDICTKDQVIKTENNLETYNAYEKSLSNETVMRLKMYLLKDSLKQMEADSHKAYRGSFLENDRLGHVAVKTEEHQYSCNACYISFADETDLAMHMKTHREVAEATDKMYKCSFCEKSFSNEMALNMHINTHVTGNNKDVFPGSSSDSSISRHVTVKSEEHVSPGHVGIYTEEHHYHDYQCNCCGKSFWDKTILDLHMRIHMEGRMGESYNELPQSSSDNSIPGQVMIKTESNPHTDIVCNNSFSDENVQDLHMNIHADGRKVGAQEEFPGSSSDNSVPGEVTFKTEKNETVMYLNMDIPEEIDGQTTDDSYEEMQESVANNDKPGHVTVKTEEYKANCTICEMLFSDKKSLDLHMNMHMKGEILSSHDVFHRNISENTSQAHVTMKPEEHVSPGHVGIYTEEHHYQCNCCGKTFWDKTILGLHMRIHMEGIMGESYNELPQSSSSDNSIPGQVMIKTESNPHTDIVCNRPNSFSDENVQDLHMNIHADGRKVGAHEEFPLANNDKPGHVTVKTEEYKANCTICEMLFSDEKSLDLHMNMHMKGEILSSHDVFHRNISENTSQAHVTIKTEEK